MKNKEITMGQLLLESLTKNQIACMLEVIASADGLKSLMDDFMRAADPDMAATVGEILKRERTKAGGKTKSRPVSHKRTMEYWNSLWRHWHEVLADVGNEEGKYAVQDHHWEEPYFGGSFFASDLEPIARDMLGLIDDVYPSVDDPELFVEALESIEASIASYPEWMGAEYGEPCELEKYATRCVLKWLWSGLQHESRSGICLLEKIYEIEQSYKLVYMNQIALVDFFVNLPADSCREIYDYLSNDETHETDLNGFYSPWHQINHAYKSRIDSSKHLETCRNHLDQNWQYGRPLIDDAIKRKEFQEAEQWLARLTSDLPDSKRLVRKYPVFYETALPSKSSADDLLGNFRCRGLKKMNAGLSLNVAMEVWKEHLHLIMPDPADAYKSDYTDHAVWCKSLHELNQNTYKALVSRWRKKHNRRRNLWRDMKAIGLSV